MWPKNIVFYVRDGNPLPDVIEERLQARPFAAPGGLDWFSEGFVHPADHLGQFAPLLAGCRLLSLRREDKVLPAGVIRDDLDKHIAKIEAAECRKLGRKEKLALKEQITDDLLPRAFTRSSRTTAWDNGKFLFVNAASHSKAEKLVSCVREAIPPFPCALVRTNSSPHALMTDWLAAGEATGSFVLDSDATLQDGSENGAKIKISRADLTAEEIRQHIATGKQVTTLGLIWRESIRFVLTDQLQLKRIQFLNVLQEEASQAGDDMASLFEATFRIMSAELAELVGDLIEALGGLVEEQDKSLPPVVGDTYVPWEAADGTTVAATMAEPFHGDAGSDPLYDRALALVLQHRKASISFTQRHLRIGYNRAARLIERMEAEGHVTPMDAIGSRQVLTPASEPSA